MEYISILIHSQGPTDIGRKTLSVRREIKQRQIKETEIETTQEKEHFKNCIIDLKRNKILHQ